MAKKMIRLLVILWLFTLTASSLLAGRSKMDVQDACLSIRQLGLDDSDLLIKVLEDPEIIPEIKSCTAYHIGHLLHQANQNSAKPEDSQQALAALRKVYQNYRDDTRHVANYKVRESVCLALGGFDKTPLSQEAIALLSEIARNDSNPAVTIACVTMLGSVSRERSAAARSLVEILEKTLDRKEISQQDINLVNLLVTSLGKLEQAEAFVPLVRVLQSGYPAYVKKATERAIISLESNSRRQQKPSQE